MSRGQNRTSTTGTQESNALPAPPGPMGPQPPGGLMTQVSEQSMVAAVEEVTIRAGPVIQEPVLEVLIRDNPLASAFVLDKEKHVIPQDFAKV